MMTRRAEILSWIGARIGKPPGFERIVRFLMPIDKCRSFPEICLVRDGNLFITRPGLPLGWHVAFFGSYEPELRDLIRTVLPNGGGAVDIGANVGWHTLLMAQLVGPQGCVLAIEANPSIREQLARNIRLNRLAQVDIIPCAVAEAERTLDFYGPSADDPGSASGHVLSDAAERTGSIRVEARTLDAIVLEKRIGRVDLVKIDVEGFEWPALQGGEQTIAKFRPYILFEFDSAYAMRAGGSPSLFFEFLRRYEYRLFSVGRNWLQSVDLSTWPDCANIFAVPLGPRSA
jgi:FkbM family methyltransferase